MTATAPAAPSGALAEDQRLGATLALSLLVHALVLLGIGFTLEDAAPLRPTLDVILTETTTPLTPKQADFLAQAANQGGGEHERSLRPRDTQTGPIEREAPGVAPRTMQAQSPRAEAVPQTRVVTAIRSETAVAEDKRLPAPADVPKPAGPERIEHDMEMARLAAEIHLRSERYAKRPKRKFVSASTQEYAWASYLREWVDRVERVGNLNYPDAARRRRLEGQVVISVAIRRDGSVERADVVQSSGVPLLDASALRIAKLAEPYAPLPKTPDDPDVLHVTRTWQFLPGGELVDR
ncbi:energy transducer TonB [Cognatilysobacter bugurensis]|uniref:Cell envelope biogenesis protein TonB n=1 Tax=Cognatilysobacter bugurensis TaxID=543356 RepID=A0A918WAC3_9GAMM|nr:energy transducer TonB [Lysobacter bugurensis]GHA88832.1 cell envelope biogenesis protein TonB [Lysobacter bugurensis]